MRSSDIVSFIQYQLDERDKALVLFANHRAQTAVPALAMQMYEAAQIVDSFDHRGMRPFERLAWLELQHDVVVKRRILALHQQVVDEQWPAPGHCSECSVQHSTDYATFPCVTVRLLAHQWYDHPGYLSSWTLSTSELARIGLPST